MNEDDLDPEPQHKGARETAERCLALIAVIARCHNTPSDKLAGWMEDHGVQAYLSEAELAFLEDPAPSEDSVVQFSWRAEALAALLWALGGIDSLDPLNAQVDLDHNEMFLGATREPEQFVEKASLRPDEVLDEAEADLYHHHWRVRDAELFEKAMPPELHPGIVYERRYALGWLVGWGTDWDDVPTDT